MTTLNHEITLHHVMMEAFMPAFAKKAMEYAFEQEEDLTLVPKYAACVACAWPLVYRLTQLGVTECEYNEGELWEYMMSFKDRNYEYMDDDFLTIDRIIEVNTEIGVWEIIDGVVHLCEDMLQISRKKESMPPRS